MRFSVSVTGRNGRGSDRRPVLPNNIIRMDDKEVFRIFFENDWSVGGTVKFVYDGNAKNVYEENIGAGEIFCHSREFVFERTPTGGGRLLEIKFTRERTPLEIEDEEEIEPFTAQYMLINNDYFADGRTVNFGDTSADGMVAGKQTNPAMDPDRHMWAQPPPPQYNASEFDCHPPPEKKKNKNKSAL
jgi:hypothetical protein